MFLTLIQQYLLCLDLIFSEGNPSTIFTSAITFEKTFKSPIDKNVYRFAYKISGNKDTLPGMLQGLLIGSRKITSYQKILSKGKYNYWVRG